MNLIERFPLRQIHNENENRLALEVVRELMRRGDDKLSKDEIEYLVMLTDQIEKFEKTVYWSDRAKVPVLDCIKMLMKEFGHKPDEQGFCCAFRQDEYLQRIN
jgi:antitoxin component HigA of HigAB toxin-antitoxin module